MHYVFTRYILAASWKVAPSAIQGDMWSTYREFMDAEGSVLEKLLEPLMDYEAEAEERKQQRAAYRKQPSRQALW